MARKNAHKTSTTPQLRQNVSPTAPVCQLVHTANGERVQRFPSEDEIRLHAYFQWEAAGQPPGDGREFWFEAERKLGGCS